MIVFSITLRSKLVAKEWSYTCRLLERTLSSIYNQADSNFKVILVCHERPELQSDYPDLIYHQVDFPAPQRVYSEMVLDRNVKELIGRRMAKSMNAEFIMNIDADDCISKNISKYLNQKNDEPIADILFVDKGYIYYEKLNKFIARSGFYRFCGSALAVRSEYCEAPESLEYGGLVDYIRSEKFCSGGGLITHCQTLGKVVKPFPFYGCIYVRPDLDSGLATSKGMLTALRRRDLRMLLSPAKRNFEKFWKAKDINQTTKDEFGFYTIQGNG